MAVDVSLAAATLTGSQPVLSARMPTKRPLAKSDPNLANALLRADAPPLAQRASGRRLCAQGPAYQIAKRHPTQYPPIIKQANADV